MDRTLLSIQVHERRGLSVATPALQHRLFALAPSIDANDVARYHHVGVRYWWVNQKQTYRQEIAGGYLWSPKRRADNSRNHFYENMRIVAPGDFVFSYWNTAIRAYPPVASPTDRHPPGRQGA